MLCSDYICSMWHMMIDYCERKTPYQLKSDPKTTMDNKVKSIFRFSVSCCLRTSPAQWHYWRLIDRLTSSILLVLHRAGMSLICLNIPSRFTMMMAASAVCDTNQRRREHIRKSSPSPPVTLPDRKLEALHHQLHPPEVAAGRRNQWPPPPAAPRETTAALRSEHNHSDNCIKIISHCNNSNWDRSSVIPPVVCVCVCDLRFSTSALLHQTPWHGAGDGEGLEERADEVTQAEGNQLLEHKRTNTSELQGGPVMTSSSHSYTHISHLVEFILDSQTDMRWDIVTYSIFSEYVLLYLIINKSYYISYSVLSIIRAIFIFL